MSNDSLIEADGFGTSFTTYSKETNIFNFHLGNEKVCGNSLHFGLFIKLYHPFLMNLNVGSKQTLSSLKSGNQSNFHSDLNY